ncbi:unnamed protein product [Amoebophrya sp. A25]|nr:unnamed protein product [Amoebophrya sp. A25]|eukprot:GSA25T00005529001.1
MRRSGVVQHLWLLFMPPGSSVMAEIIEGGGVFDEMLHQETSQVEPVLSTSAREHGDHDQGQGSKVLTTPAEVRNSRVAHGDASHHESRIPAAEFIASDDGGHAETNAVFPEEHPSAEFVASEPGGKSTSSFVEEQKPLYSITELHYFEIGAAVNVRDVAFTFLQLNTLAAFLPRLDEEVRGLLFSTQSTFGHTFLPHLITSRPDLLHLSPDALRRRLPSSQGSLTRGVIDWDELTSALRMNSPDLRTLLNLFGPRYRSNMLKNLTSMEPSCNTTSADDDYEDGADITTSTPPCSNGSYLFDEEGAPLTSLDDSILPASSYFELHQTTRATTSTTTAGAGKTSRAETEKKSKNAQHYSPPLKPKAFSCGSTDSPELNINILSTICKKCILGPWDEQKRQHNYRDATQASQKALFCASGPKGGLPMGCVGPGKPLPHWTGDYSCIGIGASLRTSLRRDFFKKTDQPNVHTELGGGKHSSSKLEGELLWSFSWDAFCDKRKLLLTDVELTTKEEQKSQGPPEKEFNLIAWLDTMYERARPKTAAMLQEELRAIDMSRLVRKAPDGVSSSSTPKTGATQLTLTCPAETQEEVEVEVSSKPEPEGASVRTARFSSVSGGDSIELFFWPHRIKAKAKPAELGEKSQNRAPEVPQKVLVVPKQTLQDIRMKSSQIHIKVVDFLRLVYYGIIVLEAQLSQITIEAGVTVPIGDSAGFENDAFPTFSEMRRASNGELHGSFPEQNQRELILTPLKNIVYSHKKNLRIEDIWLEKLNTESW